MPLTHQVGAFLRQLRQVAPGRRLHVVTDNAAAYAWLRSLRSRNTSMNLVAHLASDPRNWLHLVDSWAWTLDGSTEAETVRRLRGTDRRFSWQTPSELSPATAAGSVVLRRQLNG